MYINRHGSVFAWFKSIRTRNAYFLALILPMKRLIALMALFSLVTGETFASLVSLDKPVSASGWWDNTPYGEVFSPDKAVDGRYNDLGSPGDWSFWLAPENTGGWLQIDLESVFDVAKFEIQNTHNRWFYDRGTLSFSIDLSTDGTSYTRVFDDAQLLWPELSIQTFTLPSPIEARYVRFAVESFVDNYPGSPYFGGGISELSVYDNTGCDLPVDPGTDPWPAMSPTPIGWPGPLPWPTEEQEVPDGGSTLVLLCCGLAVLGRGLNVIRCSGR